MLSSTVRQVVKFYRLTDNYLCWTVLQHRPNFFECAYTIIIGRDKGVVTQRATSGDILPINGTIIYVGRGLQPRPNLC